MSLITIIALIVCIVIGIVSILLAYSHNSDKKNDMPDNVPVNPDILIDFMGHTKGSGIGVLGGIVDGKNGRKVLDYIQYPMDELSDDERIRIPLPIEPYMMDTIPKGDLDKSRAVRFIYPKNTNLFTESVKRTKIGQALMIVLNENYKDKTTSDFLAELNTEISNYLKTRPVDEATRDMILSFINAKKKVADDFGKVDSGNDFKGK